MYHDVFYLLTNFRFDKGTWSEPNKNNALSFLNTTRHLSLLVVLAFKTKKAVTDIKCHPGAIFSEQMADIYKGIDTK